MTVDLDSKLIAALQRNGRATYRELSVAVDAPRAAVSTRVQALLDSGTVSVVAVAHPELLGLKALAHVSIAVSGPMTPVLDALIESEAAVYISAVSGQYNVIAELRVPSHDDLYRAIAELRSQRGVRSVSTLVYVDVIKGIFMPESALQADIRLDSTDVALIELLERNGRMPFLELAEHTGLSPSAVRNRVNHLIASTALRVGAVVKRRGGGRTLAMGIGVNLGSRDDNAVSEIESLPGIEFLARTLGRYDVIATVAANSSNDLHALSERIRGIDGVSGLESWAHLEVFKEHYARSLDVRG